MAFMYFTFINKLLGLVIIGCDIPHIPHTTFFLLSILQTQKESFSNSPEAHDHE